MTLYERYQVSRGPPRKIASPKAAIRSRQKELKRIRDRERGKDLDRQLKEERMQATAYRKTRSRESAYGRGAAAAYGAIVGRRSSAYGDIPRAGGEPERKKRRAF